MVTAAKAVDTSRARLAEAVGLLVGRLSDGGTVEGAKLHLSASVAESFRGYCLGALDWVATATEQSYSGGAELDAGGFFFIDDVAVLDELSAFGDLRTAIETLPAIRPDQLDLTIQLYGVAAGGDTDRVLFVRRTNPRLPHAPGGKFFAIGSERLSRLDEPAFSFSPTFDFVVGDGWVIVLEQRPFEMLYRDIGMVAANITRWIGAITDHLPMGDADFEQLRLVAVQDSRMWRQLREIEQRGHLAGVTVDQVAQYARAVGLDPTTVVAGDRLTFDPAQRFNFLHLLNEDLYKGQLTGVLFEAQRKSPAADH
jgi:hypothetical protein